jgi:hypothetical protein
VGYCFWCGRWSALGHGHICGPCRASWAAGRHMRDLLIITPTRGRPRGAQRLVDAVTATATADTDLMFCIDEDDSSYAGLTGRFDCTRGPRDTCGGWTNKIAASRASRYRAVASIGDDHEPLTRGWDSMLLDAIDAMGGTGFAYGDDTIQGETVPTAVVISSDIVTALGWVFQPMMTHYYADLVWKDISEGSCLSYLPDVTIKHYNPSFGTAPMDPTYEQARSRYGRDGEAYRSWNGSQRAADTGTVRALVQSRRPA